MRAIAWMLVSCASVLALSGCGGLRLHSETREKQGQAAVAAWRAVDLKGFFAAERANEAKLLEQELASAEKLIAVQRELEVRKLATTPVRQLPALYDESLRPLALPGAGPIADDARARLEEQLRRARAALRQERALAREFERDLALLQERGGPRFTCAQLLDADQTIVDAWRKKEPQIAAAVRLRLREVADQCRSMARAREDYRAAVAGFDGGEIKTLFDALKAGQDRLAARRQAVDDARKVYELALAEYNAEVEAAKAGRSAVEKTQALAGKAASALDRVEKLQDALSEEFVSQERIDRIDALLASLQAGTPLESEDASKAEIAVSFLPTIADDIRAIGLARKGRAAVPLLIQRDIELARLNGAAARLANEEQDIALRTIALEAALERAHTLVNARKRLAEPPVRARPEVPSVLAAAAPGATVAAAWDGLQPDQRIALLESTSLYLDAFGRQQALANAAATRRLALSKERAIAASEINAGMWASLIGPTVDQAAEFSALGIKASDIAPILNALGILYIGHGVNQ